MNMLLFVERSNAPRIMLNGAELQLRDTHNAGYSIALRMRVM